MRMLARAPYPNTVEPALSFIEPQSAPKKTEDTAYTVPELSLIVKLRSFTTYISFGGEVPWLFEELKKNRYHGVRF